ncbi:MAG: hypothetical protein AAGN82_26055, partial [Myxococcota bacterium]
MAATPCGLRWPTSGGAFEAACIPSGTSQDATHEPANYGSAVGNPGGNAGRPPGIDVGSDVGKDEGTAEGQPAGRSEPAPPGRGVTGLGAGDGFAADDDVTARGGA